MPATSTRILFILLPSPAGRVEGSGDAAGPARASSPFRSPRPAIPPRSVGAPTAVAVASGFYAAAGDGFGPCSPPRAGRKRTIILPRRTGDSRDFGGAKCENLRARRLGRNGGIHTIG